MKHWLVKTEPETFSWNDLMQKGLDHWDGVRNYQARNNLKDMRSGDLVLVYHSGTGKEVVGIARVVREYYPDPTTDDDRWVAVDLKPLRSLEHPVGLGELKADPRLKGLPLLRHTRLSVMPLDKQEFDLIVEMARVPFPLRQVS